MESQQVDTRRSEPNHDGGAKEELPKNDSIDVEIDNIQQVPKAFLCPLTLDIFEDPLLDPSSGHSFSREAIMEWLFRQEFRGQQCQTNPLTRRPLRPGDLIPNDKLRARISHWKAHQYGIYDEEPEQDRTSIPIPWYRLYSHKTTTTDTTDTSSSSSSTYNPNAIGGEAFARRLLEAQRRDAEFRRKFILGGMDDDRHHHHRTSSSSVAASPRAELEFGRLFR